MKSRLSFTLLCISLAAGQAAAEEPQALMSLPFANSRSNVVQQSIRPQSFFYGTCGISSVRSALHGRACTRPVRKICLPRPESVCGKAGS